MDRTIKVATGEGGMKFLHRLIAAETSTLNLVDNVYIQKRNGGTVHENELIYGKILCAAA
jgi:hypothetical protein